MQRIYAQTRVLRNYFYFTRGFWWLKASDWHPAIPLSPSLLRCCVVFLSGVTLRAWTDVLHMVTVIAVHFRQQFVKKTLVLIYSEGFGRRWMPGKQQGFLFTFVSLHSLPNGWKQKIWLFRVFLNLTRYKTHVYWNNINVMSFYHFFYHYATNNYEDKKD